MSAPLLTPLDYIAVGYWQDFLAERPIAGGIVYEVELRECVLDESLASLQRVDTLLSQIRRDLMKVNNTDEQALLLDERYRNFMVFLAFYAGRVLAQQWHDTPHWYGQFELRKRYPELLLATDDFYQHMAVVYRDDVENSAINNTDTSVFFALEPIGLRLFGHIDRQFEAVQGGQVASGLYQAVSAKLPNERLPNERLPNNKLSNEPDNQVLKATLQQPIQNIDADASINTDIYSNTNKAKTIAQPLDETSINEIAANLSEPQTQEKLEPSIAEPPLTNTAPENPILIKPAPSLKIPPTPEMFTQLLIELDDIEVVQTADNTEYQQACKVLDQFEQHIAKQNNPRAQIAFSENHLTAKKQALLKLKKAAHADHTAAMLRLAMYELLDEGLEVDKIAGKESGIEWIKKAASKDDSRAQRLLSRMYYQGIGVTQDIANGKYWLEQAAKNGHAEAADLVMNWQQAQALITTQKQEQHSVKRYQILIGAIAVIAILILILV